MGINGLRNFIHPLSIKENFPEKALNFSENPTIISDDDKGIMFNAPKSLFFSNIQTCIKQKSELFDVAVRAYDEAKVYQPAITCSKLTLETLEQGVKYVQS